MYKLGIFNVMHTYIGVCGDPNPPLNGMRNYTGITEGEQVTYTCSTGYKLSGASSRTCGANGQWSGSQPSCERK